MKKYYKNIILSMIGGLIYVGIELMWRGYSHWTMFVLGGACFVMLGQLNEFIEWDFPIWKQAVIGTIIITLLEFITGCIVNIWLGWNVWDYSNTTFNVLGQICLPYIILWIPLSLVGIILDDHLRYWLFDEEKPSYRIF